MRPPTLLERAIQVAVDAHRGDTHHDGPPFILHPLRVMHAVRRFGDGAMAVAVLHDVIEKSDWTLDGLRRAGFPAPIVEAVESLTKRPDEEADGDAGYLRFVMRATADELSAVVKRADLRDNLETFLAMPAERQDEGKIARYLRGLEIAGPDPEPGSADDEE